MKASKRSLAAVPQADGRTLTIDIIEVVTFDTDGRVIEQLAYKGEDNVQFLS